MLVQVKEPTRMGMGGYKLLEKIGHGSMGTVFRGMRRDSQEIVAVKVLNEDVADNPVLVKRFQREFQAARVLDHPNLVRVLDLGEEDGTPFLVMEFVAGESLGQLLDRQGPLPETEALCIIGHIANGLHFAHERGFIHRDVKPDNILLTADGQVKLADFGLIKDLGERASLTRTGKAMGTPNYMAPEQFEDAKRVGRRGDVYSLAATFYTAVTGILPFRSRSQLGILRKKILNDFVAAAELVPGLSPAADRALAKAMQAHPELRQATCLEFLQDLTAVVPRTAPTRAEPERRTAFRFPCDLDVTCRFTSADKEVVVRGKAVNMSQQGIGIALERRVEPGTVMQVEEITAAPTLSCRVHVRWVAERSDGMWSLGGAFDRRLEQWEATSMFGTEVGTRVT